ncbi:MAG: RNA-binding S4 domain-containing protein [Clostridia bacterium]|nr:RNA-binding S4 domain-containing protein [Clostridia bacterium]MDD4572151.1 RNA-binding S4 domain-containing protein [Clostridia bacterium]
MRLDKYLKVSRLIKRRTVAKEVSDAGRITLNGRTAKAGTDIKVGDILSLSFGGRQLELEVLEVCETKRAEEACNMYKIIKEVNLRQEREDW